MATTFTFEQGNSVDTIVFDATTQEVPMFDADVTEHAVETGAANNDNVRAKPTNLRLEVTVTDYPLSSKGRGIGGQAEKGRAARILEKLVSLRADGVRLFVETGLRTYENMVIKSVSSPRDKAVSGALRISMLLTEIKTVRNESVPVKLSPTNTKAKPKVDGGKQPTTPTDDATKRKSWLAGGADSLSDGLKKVGSILGN
jgi:hypothetical protein